MSAYPVQVEDAMWIVPLYFVLVPDDVVEPHADRRRATRMNRGSGDRLPNMESPPGSEVGAVDKAASTAPGAGPRAPMLPDVAPRQSMTPAVDTVIVGAGQAGLSVSHELAAPGVDHIILERGRVGETWRGRWDSFCLVLPNWTVELPPAPYPGDAPDASLPNNDT